MSIDVTPNFSPISFSILQEVLVLSIFNRFTFPGQKQLCTRDKEVSNLYDLFSTRHSLHRRAYQHKVVKLIDHMVGEVFVKANEGLLIEGRLWLRR